MFDKNKGQIVKNQILFARLILFNVAEIACIG